MTLVADDCCADELPVDEFDAIIRRCIDEGSWGRPRSETKAFIIVMPGLVRAVVSGPACTPVHLR